MERPANSRFDVAVVGIMTRRVEAPVEPVRDDYGWDAASGWVTYAWAASPYGWGIAS